MKNLLLFSFCLISSLMNSQTTIVEEKFTKEDQLVDSYFLPHTNSMIIAKGKNESSLTKSIEINNIYSYDYQGNKNILFKDLQVYDLAFSNSEKNLFTHNLFKGSNFFDIKFLRDGKSIDLNHSDSDNFNYDINHSYPNSNRQGLRQNYTSKYQFYLTNKKGKTDFNFKKDDIYLSVFDIFLKKKEVFKIDKPNLDRLIGPDFIKPTKKVGLKLVLNYDESIDLITKSISKDYKKTILYKTRYSNDGKKLNDIPFELNFSDKTFLYSLNNGGNMEMKIVGNNAYDIFEDDLSINNFYEDVTNGDIYIYGLYGDGDKIETLNSRNVEVKGYYVFKFDKNGKKIWESINKIEDEIINKGHVMYEFAVSLEELNSKMCFHLELKRSKNIGSDQSIVKLSYGILDKSSGSVVNSKTMFFEKKEFANKGYNIQSIIAFQSNPKFSDYVKKLKSKKKLFLFTSFSDKGAWLVETDYKDYYKVTLFND